MIGRCKNGANHVTTHERLKEGGAGARVGSGTLKKKTYDETSKCGLGHIQILMQPSEKKPNCSFKEYLAICVQVK